MKKAISLFLIAVMILSLCACSGKEQAKNTGPVKAKEGQLLVGFGRVDLSPAPGSVAQLVGYGGNGTPPTKMTGILDPIYGTCVAVTDSEGKTALIYTLDTLYTVKKEVDAVRKAVTEKTGIAGENLIISSIHTHSSVEYQSISGYADKMAQAAADALADRAPATVQTGSTVIEGMNFVRHYYTESGIVVGDNFNAATKNSPRVSHTTQADGEMPMVRFVREGDKKDVLLVNWQAHPKVASTGDTAVGMSQRSLLSADFIGFCRKHVEEKTDCLFAYYNGASGNLNPRSDLRQENQPGFEHVDVYGAALGDKVIAALGDLKDVPAGKVTVQQQMFAVKPTDGVITEMELTAIRIGSLGFATVPFEMFDTNGMQIKDGSDCETTFVLTCASMPRHSYIPADYVWDYNTGTQKAYELTSCRHVRGTAEEVADELVAMLNGLAG